VFSPCSGNDIEGKDDVTEGTSSHFSVAVSCRESGLSTTAPTCVDEVAIRPVSVSEETVFENVVSADVILFDSLTGCSTDFGGSFFNRHAISLACAWASHGL